MSEHGHVNEELKAAAERYEKAAYPRASASGGKDYDSYYMPIQEMEDMRKLADAYVAEHNSEREIKIEDMGPRIKGVGVLRYPDGQIEKAREMARGIQDGVIFALPNTRDSEGCYCWDFRIEGSHDFILPHEEILEPIVVSSKDN